MGIFQNRSFNVKLVNDKLAADDSSNESRDPAEGVLIAQAYAQIAVETLGSIAYIIGATTVTILVAKTASNAVNAGLNHLTK